jgi:hypothetical protein
MAPKTNARKWNDIQTAIATIAIATTLGMWELFAAPVKAETVQAQEPIRPPAEPSGAEPTGMPQVKIIFTQIAPQTPTVQQPQIVKKKKKKNNHNSGGGGSVTQTQSS